MGLLTPSTAASIATSVYDLRDSTTWAKTVADGAVAIDGTLGITDNFTLAPGGRFEGTSGGNFLRSQSGFGYIASGVGTFQNELLISTRGTVTAYDWVTDAMQSVKIGPGGYPVHAGFQTTFESFKPTIRDYLVKNKSKITTVHLVGHSLGGALATLIADYLADMGLKVKLYTFGCPRTGFEGFARNLTQKVGAENIYRVHHSSDPVAMVPIYPFYHVAFDRAAYTLPWDGSPVSFGAHKMGNYTKTIGPNTTWLGLKRAGPSKWESAEAWLDQASKQGGRVQMFSAKALWMIMKAMEWILEDLITPMLGSMALGVVTVVDVMAKLLYQGALTSMKVSGYVTNLMITIMKFLGRTLAAGASLTVSLIKWVLDLLFNFISSSAQLALQKLNQ